MEYEKLKCEAMEAYIKSQNELNASMSSKIGVAITAASVKQRVKNLITYVQMEIDAPYITDEVWDAGYDAACREILAKLEFCLGE